MQSRNLSQISCNKHLSNMLYLLRRRFRRLCSKIRRFVWRKPTPKLVIKSLAKMNTRRKTEIINNSALHNKNAVFSPIRPRIRLATFNAALFSLAPAIPKSEKSIVYIHESPANNQPKGILKQSPIHHGSKNEQNPTKTRPKVSINLPENEISLAQNKILSIINNDDDDNDTFSFDTKINVGPIMMRSPICFPASWLRSSSDHNNYGSLYGISRSVYDVLKEVDADVLALQDVKADEENDMKPLSELARALGMYYVFAESWAPEYGNAVLSKWPIKRWNVQKIFDDKDFRNVIKATIDVPLTGEVNIYNTQLDHLDENWRMKQINAIIHQQSNVDEPPHILAGGLNSLDASDYSIDRWNNIVKYYEELGKPTPRVEVTNFLKGRGYGDAKEYPGECEPVVMIAKGQNVQGTCKYGTRVDYILGSPGLSYEFVPGSYSVVSSKGTSDHHIVKVDIVKVADDILRKSKRSRQKILKQRIATISSSNSCSSRKGVRKISC